MPRKQTAEFWLDENGQFRDRQAAKEFFAGLEMWAGKKVVIEYRSPPASNSARGYLHGVVIKTIREAMHEAGVTPLPSSKTLYEHFKAKYLPWKLVSVWGVEHWEPPSAADLDSTEFYWFVEAIRTDEIVTTLEIDIPDPDSQYKSYRV